MKRTRAQQPKVEDPQDEAAANPTTKPQRRAKQPKAAGGGKTKPGAAGARVASASGAAAAAAEANAGSAASSPGPPEMAPTVPDVCVGHGERDAVADADARTVDWDLDGGMNAAGAWWTWGVDEEKLLGWFPFVEEDFRCVGGGAEVAAFDHDIWSIW